MRDQMFDIFVCTDCAMFIANGEISPDSETKESDILLGLDKFLPRHLSLDSSENNCMDKEFSHSRCDCCGSRLGGARFRAAAI